MSDVLHATPSTFFDDVVRSPVPVLVDFYADWCGPCRLLAPTLERLATAVGGKARIVKVDIDTAPELAREYRIEAVPTLLFVVDGQVVGRTTGAVPESALRQALDRLIEAGSVA